MPIKQLAREDRMRLIKFVCSFAWADLEVSEEERDYVRRLITALRLDPTESAQALRWLEVPPRVEELDPQEIPHEHRQVFLESVRTVITRDGVIDPAEAESFELLRQLVR